MVTKGLLVKGLGGLAAVAGVVGGGYYFVLPKGKKGIEGLLEKVGLRCGNLENMGNQGVVCTIESKGIEVKKGEESFNFPFIHTNDKSTAVGRIKAYGDGEYSHGFRFSIEGADMTWDNGNNSKLEEFETYEIKEEGGKYILSLKKKSSEERGRILGLTGLGESCKLPDNGSTTCGLTAENIDSLNFEGKTGKVTGAGSLKVERVDASETDFPHGFKFTLTPSSDITVPKSGGNIVLKTGKAEEFKIRKNGGTLSLEKAWTLESLTKKVGLKCSNGTCTISEAGGMIKQEENEGENLISSSDSGRGQIKVTESEDHEHGLKFSIEGGDIGFNSSSHSITTLEEFDVYEIKRKENNGGWYLTRKVKGADKKRSMMSLPDGCELPKDENNDSECELDSDKINKIKFEGKGNHTITLEDSESPKPKLKIKRTKDGNFPMGFKFILETEKELSLASSLTVKPKTNTEFKIRKSGSGENITLTLERAWDAVSLGQKIGVTCSKEPKECSFGGEINVWETDSNNTNGAKVTTTQHKLTYEEGQEDYNQGFKFRVSGEVGLTGGSNSTAVDKIKQCEDTGNTEITYEIMDKVTGTTSNAIWYLIRKWNSSDG